MALSPRVRRLERTIAPDEEGYRSCRVCGNGTKRQIVIHMQGDPPAKPAPPCPNCGRDITYWINILNAEPPPQFGAASP